MLLPWQTSLFCLWFVFFLFVFLVLLSKIMSDTCLLSISGKVQNNFPFSATAHSWLTARSSKTPGEIVWHLVKGFCSLNYRSSVMEKFSGFDTGTFQLHGVPWGLSWNKKLKPRLLCSQFGVTKEITLVKRTIVRPLELDQTKTAGILVVNVELMLLKCSGWSSSWKETCDGNFLTHRF